VSKNKWCVFKNPFLTQSLTRDYPTPQSLLNSPIRLTLTAEHVTPSMQQYPSNWHVLPSVQLYNLIINNYALTRVLRPDRIQAVGRRGRRFRTVEARVQSQSCPYSICNEQGGTGTRISHISYHSTNAPYSSIARGWWARQSEAAVPGSHSHFTTDNKTLRIPVAWVSSMGSAVWGFFLMCCPTPRRERRRSKGT
jgi:hypothetical protein